ncbi:rod shape-determining protein MreC [Thermoflexibacter ruber]|uniref:Cell shape-determining protein MreC n=1 Tax=Thermoflexibacter ruber TaxID=1003 RepID=A0A1I2H4K2_9BACT|nr:rod shape-determining protein MreC [Thermoflexibacter ruber]SFF24300.1 rod shape-determining protein MreC [Thermoflexibacter ruber]
MRQLFLFLYRYRFFFTFLAWEFVCTWLIIRNNAYQSAAAFTSSNQLVAYIYDIRNYFTSYIALPRMNDELAQENKKLYEQVAFLKKEIEVLEMNKAKQNADFLANYEYIPAKVINNSLLRTKNYLTINKGRKDGIEEGMGVVSNSGIIGKVKACTDNYSTVISLLHENIQVASRIKKNNIICTTKWDLLDYREANVLEIGRHVNLSVGDTIVASGFSEVYPENYPIGIVKTINYPKSNSFLEVKIRLTADFASLTYVYVIKNKKQNEIDKLEKAIKEDK